MKLKFNQLVPNDYNPRKLFRGAAMEELKTSIEQVGLIEPLAVRKKGQKYEVVAGMRRYYALKELGTVEVECNVLTLTDPQAKLVSLVENIQRDNLSPMEESRAYAINLNLDFDKSKNFSILFNEKKMKGIGEFAAKIGKSTVTIKSRLHLLVLPEEIQSVVHLRNIQLQIAEGIAELGKIKDVDIAQKYMLDLYEDYKKEDFGVTELERRVKSKIEFEEKKESEEADAIEEERANLETKIEETEEAIEKEQTKIDGFLDDISNKEGLEIDTTLETDELLKALKKELGKYEDDGLYEATASRINILEDAISDIHFLTNRINEKGISICPYCHAGIDSDAIKNKEAIYQEELDEKKEARGQIAGMRGFIGDISTKIKRQINSINSKNNFLKEFREELENLE